MKTKTPNLTEIVTMVEDPKFPKFGGCHITEPPTRRTAGWKRN